MVELGSYLPFPCPTESGAAPFDLSDFDMAAAAHVFGRQPRRADEKHICRQGGKTPPRSGFVLLIF